MLHARLRSVLIGNSFVGSRVQRVNVLHGTILALLAAQFLVVQITTGVLYGDAPRNLHFGMLTAERPRFLLDAPDPYERIKGFQPTPESLAPRGLYANPPGALHPWWGPVAPLLFAGVWLVTRSYLALQLVVPLASAVVVLLTYRFARAVYDARRALVAAAFLACFPLFRDYGSTAYTEALSTLALSAALFAVWRGRTVPSVVLGTLGLLSKMDLLVLYVGVVLAVALFAVWRRETRLPLRHLAWSVVGPAVLSAPWIWFHYLQGSGPGGGNAPSLSFFAMVAPQMLDLLFYIPWYGAVLVLAAIGWCVFEALRTPDVALMQKVFLASWLGLGLFVVLVYAATPGAGNSPRIMLPALPPLALLFADGFTRLQAAWRRRIGFFLGALFAVLNIVVIGYYAVDGADLRSYRPVWAALRAAPSGFVLTERYWETMLYARQPATWFEADAEFQRNIMHDADNFARYVEQHPIRYVVLPAGESALAAPEVYRYLEARSEARLAGRFTVFVLP